MSQVWDDLAKDLGGLHDPPGSLPDRVHERLREKVLGWALQLPQGATLLDLGCGSGKLAHKLVQRRPDLKIIGMDISQAMLDVASRASADKENPRWIKGEAAQWPLPPHSVDAVVAMDLLAHVAPGQDLDAMLAEAQRVCHGWLLLEIKTPWSLALILQARRILDWLLPRQAREFALGLKEHSQRIPIHIHSPRKILKPWPGPERLKPWPWLPSPSTVYVLRLDGKQKGLHVS